MIRNIQNWWKKRAIYAQTRRELEALSDRDLHDLGLHRGMINELAYESAYGDTELNEKSVDIFKVVSDFFKFEAAPTNKDRIDAWLGESTDIVDLERRLRLLDLNQAPWQTSNRNLQGWV